MNIKYTDIVWDFNGTVIDDVEAGIRSVNKMLSERGLKTIRDAEHYRSIFRFPIIEYYRSLGFDFEAEPYEVLAPIWVDEYLKNSKSSPLREGFLESLQSFGSLGLRQHILSATELGMLRSQLDSFEILEDFDEIYGLDNIHAHSKTELAKDFSRKHPESSVLFIGDTEHDYTTALIMNADCALVCGGHQSRETLEKCEGAVIFESIKELCDTVVKNGSI